MEWRRRPSAPSGGAGLRRHLAVALILCSVFAAGIYFAEHSGIPGAPSGNAGLVAFNVVNPFVDQSQVKACASVTTCNSASIALTNPGDAIFVDIGSNTSGLSISNVKDNHGNSLSLLQASTGSSNTKLWVYEEYNLAQSGALLVWVNVSTSATYSFEVLALGGVPAITPVDATGTASSGHSTAISASVTTTIAHDLVVLFALASGSDVITATGGDALVQTNAGVASTAALDEADASTGSFTESATGGNTRYWVAFEVALKLGTPPTAPTALAQSAATVSSITWTWTAPLGAVANYSVWNYKNSACTTLNLTASVTVASYTFSGLGSAEAAWIKVAAYNSTGQGTLTGCVEGVALPNAPSGMSAAGASTTSITASWTNPGGTLSDDYLYWQAGSACAAATKIDIGSVATTKTVTGLTPNTLYCFYSQAVSLGGASASSAIVTARTPTVPAAPTGLTVGSVTSTTIPLSWTAPSGGGIQNYTVWQWSGASCTGPSSTAYNVGTGTSYVVGSGTALGGASTFAFEVAAWNATGQSLLSSCVSGTTLPGGPSGISDTAATTTSITWSWTNPSGTLTDDYLFWQAGSGCSSATKIDIGSVVTTYTLTGLASASPYCAYVQAVDSSGASASSSMATGTTLPTAPTSPAIGSATTSTLTVTWSNPSGTLTDDYLFWQIGSSCSSATKIDIGSVVNTYTLTGLAGATTYCSYLEAVSAGGPSVASSTVSAATLPGGPTGISASSVTTTSITWGWTNPSGTLTDDYLFWQAGSSCASATQIDIGSVVTSYTLTGLNSASPYCAYVQAVDSSGSSASSSTATGTTLPTAPTSPAIGSPTTSTLTVTWSNPSGTLTDDYLFWQGGTSCSSATKIDIGSVVATYTLTGLSGAATYCAYVEAVSAGGASAASSTVSAATLPGAPSSLGVTATTTSSVSLSWTNPSGTLTDIYVFWQIHSTSCSAATQIDVGSVTTTYTDSGLSSGQLYCFYVEAVDGSGPSAASNVVSAVTNTVPAAPTGLSATPVSATAISLSWMNPGGGGLTGTTVKYGSSCASLGSTTNLGVVTSYILPGLTPATGYSVEVIAANATGSSAPSSCVSSGTLPAPVGSFSVATVGPTWATLSWTLPPQAPSNVTLLSGPSCGSWNATTSAGVTTGFNLTGFQSNAPFCVQAEDWSSWGTNLSGTVSSATLPLPPTVLEETALGAHFVDLEWVQPRGGLTSNTVVWGTSCGNWTNSAQISPAAAVYGLDGLSAATSYCFAVTARNSTLSSGTSASLTVVTEPDPSGSGTGGGGFLQLPGGDLATEITGSSWLIPFLVLLILLAFAFLFWFLAADRRRRRR
jgi:hypothetical protein